MRKIKIILVLIVIFFMTSGIGKYQGQYYEEYYVINPNDILDNPQNGGKCVANSIATTYSILWYKHTGEMINFSEDYIYANRQETDYLGVGMDIKQALYSLENNGIAEECYFKSELEYPQILEEFNELDEAVKHNAEAHKSSWYEINSDYDTIVNLMLSKNIPVIINIESRYLTNEYINEFSSVDAEEDSHHALVVVGFCQDYIIAVNSWDKLKKIYIHKDIEISDAYYIDRLSNPEIEFIIDSNNYYYDKDEFTMDTKAKIINNKTYIPLRVFAETNGFDVTWNEEKRSITMINNNDIIIFYIDSKYIEYNSNIVDIGYKPIIDENNRTLIVVRELSELLGYNVKWDGTNRNVVLTDNLE